MESQANVLSANTVKKAMPACLVYALVQSMTFVSERLQSFLLENGIAKRTAYQAALCTEEIAADYLMHRKAAHQNEKKAYMDIKVFRKEDLLEIIVRNFDDPYNPLVFEREEESFSKIGISMIQAVSKDISYSYAYHLNIVTIAINA